jgi:hypothetical protein
MRAFCGNSAGVRCHFGQREKSCGNFLSVLPPIFLSLKPGDNFLARQVNSGPVNAFSFDCPQSI